MAIILETNKERLALQGILNYLYETHTRYWSTMGDIDFDKPEYRKLLELKEHIEARQGKDFFDDNDFDLCRFLTQLNGDN